MKRIAQLAIGTIAIALGARAVAAQDVAPQPETFFRRPTFVLMPGIVMTPVLSGVGDAEADTKTYVNARFMTVIPTRLPWFTALAGAQFLPNGPRAGGVRATQPNLFYGGIISMPGITEATDGWLALSLDPLGLYSFGGGGTSDLYGHDFVLEGAAVINVGQKMMANMPAFSGWSVYVLLDQVLTHVPRDENGDKDYWNPVALAGITIPIGR